MLMGAIANMRPDLFAGIIAEVPFVDVLNTMLDDTLPLTPPEWPEWGNPLTDADGFRDDPRLFALRQCRAQDYPAMLVLAGLTDPRVTYWEPAKWVAQLRARRTNTNAAGAPHQHGRRAMAARRALRPAEGESRSPMRSRSRRRGARARDPEKRLRFRT